MVCLRQWMDGRKQAMSTYTYTHTQTNRDTHTHARSNGAV